MIRRNTPARAKQNREYNQKVRLWLKEPQHMDCIVSQILRWDSLPATQCHHQRGRVGALLLDNRFWLPVSSRGHQWIDRNPAAAKALGLLAGPWNHQPGPSVPPLNLPEIISAGKRLRDLNTEWSKK